MYLTGEEERILKGEEGVVKQKAMEIVVALGEIFDADRLIPVGSVQISGVSYKTIGDAGLEWIESLAGGKVCVPSTLNPAGMDLELWELMKIPRGFAEKQLKIISAFKKLGVKPICTCTPYLVGNLPRFKEHIAWSESSAVCYANSVIGARTNRESGPSALASALTGKTGNYGYHLDEARRPNLKVEVEADLREESDFGALGYFTGKLVENGVPYFTGVKRAEADELKALAASLAASGGVALYHMKKITPESKLYSIESLDTMVFTSKDMKKVYDELTTLKDGGVDLVCLGCPHASLEEIRRTAALLEGRRVALNTKLWIFTNLGIRRAAERHGYLHTIKAAGGEVYSDCCMIVAPIEDLEFHTIAINSAKAAVYAPTVSKMQVFYGTLEKCVNIAVTGRVE